MAKKKETIVDTPFYDYIWRFYQKHKKEIKREYTPLTRKILSYADYKNIGSFLRAPQYEAFEIYVFLKEYLNNARLADIFNDWRQNRGKFTLKETDIKEINEKYGLFAEQEREKIENDTNAFLQAWQQLDQLKQDYSNYIFSLTMGTGKTVLMAVCIFYEFLLARKYPQDPRFCHNALVLAPDTTVLQSLKEIQTFDRSKVFLPEYANMLSTMVKFHFLEDDGVTLPTQDGSDYNLIISTSQKIILRRQHAAKTAADKLFEPMIELDSEFADLYEIDEESLQANHRFQKLTRLKNLGIYVDEAHHAFGQSLKNDMEDRSKKTSLRLTIDTLAKELKDAGSAVIACYNFTGTPYVDNHLMPEVVYEYDLRKAIDNHYLKEVEVLDYENVHSSEFVKTVVSEFVKKHTENGVFKRYEGMLPKIAFFASSIDELQKELQPAVENALIEQELPTDSILINVGDDKLTKADDLREFLLLDTTSSAKQFILLVGKGKEGWNCRSLFSVALFRKPKSTIFVLQATMRCLRSVTTDVQTGMVFLSKENLEILQNELRDNFRLSVEDLTQKQADNKKERHIYIREKVKVKIVEKIPKYKIYEKIPDKITIFDNDFDFSKYKRTRGEHKLSQIDSASIRKEIEINENRQFTELSLIAELSMYLTQNPKEGESIKFPPTQLKKMISNTTEGIEGILEKVNYSNEILYDWVIPKLFSNIYEVKLTEGEPREIIKYIVKDPPPENKDENGNGYYRMKFDDEHFVSENDSKYKSYNQRGNKKSFDLSGYGFDSKQGEKSFFDRNLFFNNEIKHIWFTGMLTNGQSDFYIHYIDPESHALRSYYPDFLIEMNDGKFYIVETKGENLIDKASTNAKIEYARRMSSASKMEYVFIPSSYADMILQEFIRQNNAKSNIKSFEVGL